jgi:hypothetical protein
LARFPADPPIKLPALDCQGKTGKLLRTSGMR